MTDQYWEEERFLGDGPDEDGRDRYGSPEHEQQLVEWEREQAAGEHLDFNLDGAHDGHGESDEMLEAESRDRDAQMHVFDQDAMEARGGPLPPTFYTDEIPF
jgi:hypothetical protein